MIVGVVLLLLSLAGVTFGVYMALDHRTYESGVLFTIWWIPAVAAASGVIMRDSVTFTVGALCFLVAGVAFTLKNREGSQRRPDRGRRTGSRGTDKRPLFEAARLSLPEKAKLGLSQAWEYRKTVSQKMIGGGSRRRGRSRR